jgi:hypothetical protein
MATVTRMFYYGDVIMGDKFLICRNITNKAPVAVCQTLLIVQLDAAWEM